VLFQKIQKKKARFGGQSRPFSGERR